MANEVYLEDLISYDEFKNLQPEERSKYIAEKFYNGVPSPFKIFAEVINIRPYVIEIEAKYFLTSDNRAVEFRICSDKTLSKIGTTGHAEGIPRNGVLKYCKEHNLNKGDEIICCFQVHTYQQEIDKGHYLTFLIEPFEKNFTSLESVYEKFGITYNSHKFYELRNNDNQTLEIFVQKNISEELNQNLQELHRITGEIDDLKRQLENLKKTFDEKYSSEEEKLKKKLDFLQAFDVSLNFSEESQPINYADEDLFDCSEIFNFHSNFDTIVYWQGFLYTNYDGLAYDYMILLNLYFALQTNQLILLVGNPGTGKTSLVRALAKSFKFEDAAIISVQSNWTDRSDLLGYYNPIEKSYMSTEFLDALIKFSRQAVLQPDKLFIICLDEMNLASVEYYFAEFLSSLQDTREITLYSESMKNHILYELEINGADCLINGEIDREKISAMNMEERKYYFELYRMARMIADYPAKFKIPENVKFFGTLNQDETTHDISPKVIDRSYVIRLEKFTDDIGYYSGGDFSKPLRYKKLKDFYPEYPYPVCEEYVKKEFEEKMCAIENISRRVTKQTLWNEDFDAWTEMLGFETIKDLIIASCLLPKIRFDEDSYKEKFDMLEELCRETSLSKNILERMNTGKEADFWRS